MLLSLKSRLLSAEQDFLSGLVDGGDALVAFESRWESLLEDIDYALETPESHPEISALAHIMATRVAALADASIDMCDIYDTHSSLFMVEIDNLMSELSIEDPPLGELPVSPNSETQRSVSTFRPRPATISYRKRSRSPDMCPPETAIKRRRTQNARKATSNNLPHSPSSPTTAHSITDTVGHIKVASTTPTLRSSRKRRLSDVASSPSHPLKRLYTGPRVHAVSDSYTSLFREEHWAPLFYEDVSGSPTTPDLSVPLDAGALSALPLPRYNTASQRGIFDEVSDLQTSCEDPAQSLLQFDDIDAFLDTLLRLPVMTSPQLFASNTSFDTSVCANDTFGSLSPLCPPLTTPHSPSTSPSSPSSCPRTPPLRLSECDIPLYMLDHTGAPTDDFAAQSTTRLEPSSALRTTPSSQSMNVTIHLSSHNIASEPTAEWLPFARDGPTHHLLKCPIATISQIKRDYPCLVPEAAPLLQTSYLHPI